MRANIFFLTVLFGLFSSSARSADWKLVGQSSNYYAHVDTSSIVTQKKYRKAWVMWSEIEEESRPSSGSLPIARSSKILSYYNCAEHSSFEAQRTEYDDFFGRGKSIRSLAFPLSNSGFNEIVPDTVGESVFNYICSIKLK